MAQQAHVVLPERKVKQALRVLMEYKVPLARKARQVPTVHRVQLVHRVLQAIAVWLVPQALPEHRASKALKVTQVLKVKQANKDHKVHRVCKV
jgi:hypothetical protein